jgi:hypothetical protein
MRHTRRLIAILVSSATWWIAASSVAYAMRPADNFGTVAVTSSGSAGTPLWESLALVALGALLAVGIVSLGITLNRPRRSEPSPRSQPLLRA